MDTIKIPLDTWQIILGKLSMRSQLRLKQVCKLLYGELKLYNFEKEKYAGLLTNEIIKQHPYIKKLYLAKTLDLSSLKYLDSLYIKTNIPNNYLDNIDVKEIKFLTYVLKNKETVNLNHMTKLSSLRLHHNEVTYNDIANVNLTEFDMGNNRVNYISNLTNLTTLIMPGYKTNNNELININLTTLKITSNYNIPNFLHMTNLTELYLPGNYISDLNKLSNLKILNISHSYMPLDNIKQLHNLEELYAERCPCITNFNCFTKLRILNMNNNDSIKSHDISELSNLTELYAQACYRLTDLNFLINLRVLDITYCQALLNKHVNKLQLEAIYTNSNSKVIKINTTRLRQINNIKLVK